MAEIARKIPPAFHSVCKPVRSSLHDPAGLFPGRVGYANDGSQSVNDQPAHVVLAVQKMKRCDHSEDKREQAAATETGAWNQKEKSAQNLASTQQKTEPGRMSRAGETVERRRCKGEPNCFQQHDYAQRPAQSVDGQPLRVLAHSVGDTCQGACCVRGIPRMPCTELSLLFRNPDKLAPRALLHSAGVDVERP